jgi:hypothetical protein
VISGSLCDALMMLCLLFIRLACVCLSAAIMALVGMTSPWFFPDVEQNDLNDRLTPFYDDNSSLTITSDD